MKTLIIYTSQTGFTKKYVNWLAERIDADVLKLRDAQEKENDFFETYDAIVYGGWNKANKIVNSHWFFSRASNWKEKRLVLMCVGASLKESPELNEAMKNFVPKDQQSYIKLFYCQGGLDYEKLKFFDRFLLKTLAFILKRKKNLSEVEKTQAELMGHSYDISDVTFIEPIAEYLESSL